MSAEDQLDDLWDLCAKTWGAWLACVVLGGACEALGADLLGSAVVAVGMGCIAYFYVRLIAFSIWRKRKAL